MLELGNGCDRELMSTRLRAEGLTRGLREGSGGAEVGVRVLAGHHDVAWGRALATELLDADGHETAIFVGSDELDVVGITAKGHQVPVIQSGTWVL